jgi:hypothetical protein
LFGLLIDRDQSDQSINQITRCPDNQIQGVDSTNVLPSTSLKIRAVQDGLAKRKLLSVARESMTAVPVYTVLRPWRR